MEKRQTQIPSMKDRPVPDVSKLKKFRLPAALLLVIVGALIAFLLRGGFHRFEITPYPLPPPAFATWNEVLAHPRDISIVTFQTGVVHMDACLNLDPASPKQADCDHAPRDLAVLVHWVHHPRFGDFLIDAGFNDSFAKHPPYGNYTEAMRLFNWIYSITNRQQPGEDLAAQLARLNVHPMAVFFTHFHPDHTAGVPALGPQTEFIFGKAEASFLARAAVANHFSGKSKFSAIDFSAAPAMSPLGPSVDLFGDGSLWAISVPGHTDDDIAYLINGPEPTLLTGDASHFAWAFNTGVAPRGWDKAGTARGYESLKQLRAFATAFPSVKIIYGHEAAGGP
jgi:glyoxylase-like metal-dependent hydrolase (beta-lactamase superfamily II)